MSRECNGRTEIYQHFPDEADALELTSDHWSDPFMVIPERRQLRNFNCWEILEIQRMISIRREFAVSVWI